MNDLRGSVWRKWDLHVHTPASFHWNGARFNQKTPKECDVLLDELIEKVVQSDVAAFGIMDYWTFDGYLAIRDRLTARKLNIPKAIFPGMELRIEAPVDFRLNIQVVLSDSLTKQQLHDFKAALRIGLIDRALSDESLIAFACTLDPSKARVHGFDEADLKINDKLLQLGSMTAKVTRESLRHAIKQIPANTCLVIMPYDTSDGLSKLDWEKHPHDDNYFMQSAHIFETREPDNVDLFHGRETDKNRKFLGNFIKTMGGKPKPAISGSDAHKFADYGSFPGNRVTWIKADPTYEGLRQTLYEPLGRVSISPDKPLEPLLTIRNVVLDFPVTTTLVSDAREKRSDKFCMSGKTEITFSPYLTCLIGGRGSGKSTLLNLLHEKLEPGKTIFFSENSLEPEATTSIEDCVSIDGDTEKKSVEFLQQNEIEQFASAPLGFTEAIFHRLTKRDAEGKLAAVESELIAAMIETSAQGDRLKAHYELIKQISTAEKELATAKTLIASFENVEYKEINIELGKLNKELQGLRNWRSRLETLIKDIRVMRGKYNFPASDNPSAYETEFFTILKSIDEISLPFQGRISLADAISREAELSKTVSVLKQKLEDFLKGRGLSQENLADVGKANELVALIEQELPAQKAKEMELGAQIVAFRNKRELVVKRIATVTALLEPINITLSQLGKEVKAIELRYEFDEAQFAQAMVKHIQDLLGESAPRIDHLGSMLEDVDFANLATREDFIFKLPEKQATAKLLRDFFSIPQNFALLLVEAEKKLMDFGSFGRIRVSYDGKPVESSSFGQRCTAAIVILLLLGNTPIVIDEPEAHLDSALIANYLVELVKTVKLNRQIIFATHNANFVVNGDAELIHALEMTDDKVTKIQNFTIEDFAYRGRLLALEGGPDAFLKREHRYGIS